MTCASPTSSRIFAISISMNAPGVQSAAQPADPEQEVRDDLRAARRVRDFGMELHAVDRLRLVPERRRRGLPLLRGGDVTRRRRFDVVAVAHPHRRSVSPASKPSNSRPARSTVTSARPYSRFPRPPRPALEVRDELHPVADTRAPARHRAAPRSARRRAFIVHGVGPAAAG